MGQEINRPTTGSDMSLVKNHLNLRTRTSVGGLSSIHGQQDGELHLQIVGFTGARKAEQRFASYRRTSARRRASQGVSSLYKELPSSESEDGCFPFIVKSFTSLPQISTLLSKSAGSQNSHKPKVFRLKSSG